MTNQITLPREVVEQLMEALDAVSAGAVSLMTVDAARYAGRAALANAERVEQSEPESQHECLAGIYSSSVCVRGVKGCIVDHGTLVNAERVEPEDGCAPNHMCNGHRVHIPTGECCNKCGATSW